MDRELILAGGRDPLNTSGSESGRLVHTMLKLFSSGSVRNSEMMESSKAWGFPGMSEVTCGGERQDIGHKI
ncbi:unnamed protein product [Ectocarpus fasciculatus]